VTIRVRAPATTANVGAGFDCAAAALDLWNELEVGEGGEAPDPDHLAVQAFSRLAPLDGHSFSFTERIPRERGLGSSAATIALGLVAGALVAGRELDAEALLELGLPLEGHPDNLAAALAGGFCLTWDGRVARIADDAPAVPVAVVPTRCRMRTRAIAWRGPRCSGPRWPRARRSCSPRRPTIVSTSRIAPRTRRCSPRCARRCLRVRSARRSRARGRR
jgi:homoserine kinase